MLIAMFGTKGSGKDTFASMLFEHMDQGEDCRLISFADAVRAATAGAVGMDIEYFRALSLDRQYKEQPVAAWAGKSPRDLLNLVGMTFREHVSEDHCAKIAVEEAERHLRIFPDDLVVITDCRFRNEARMVKDAGGIVVGIRRPETWPTERPPHPMEAEPWEAFEEVTDYIIENDGTVDELRAYIDHVLHMAQRRATWFGNT